MVPKSGRYMFKVSVIGDYAVGKTSIIKRYMTNSFDEGYKATLGAAISTFKTSVSGSDISLQVWDLAGQTSFQRVRVQYLFGTDFAVVVFDLTREDTLDCVKEWVKDVRQGAPEVLLFLVGNKADLKEDRMATPSSAEKLRKNLNMLGYLETSAKAGTNIKELFQTISKLLLDHSVKVKT
ncbi:MAG: Rab family GTPase [Candidatus Thorarchaeota archaeon]